MSKHHIIITLILAMASLLLSIPSYSQDKGLLARADSLYREGRSLYDKGYYKTAIVSFEEAAEIRRKERGENSAKRASCLSNIGRCYESLNNYDKALEYHQQALAIREKVYGKEHQAYANSLTHIGECYYQIDDYIKALEYHKQALDIKQRMLGEDDKSIAINLDRIGGCYRFYGDLLKAREYHQQALDIRGRALGKEHPSYAISLNNIGLDYLDLGDYSKALECYQRSLEINETFFGKEHPSYATNLINIGAYYDNLGDYIKAIEYYQQALVIREKVYGTMHLRYAAVLGLMGNSYASYGNVTKALEYHRQALAIRERLYGKENLSYATSLRNIGSCFFDAGEYNKALELYQQVLAIEGLSRNGLYYATTLGDISNCYYRLHDFAKALAYCQQALTIREQIYGKNDPRITTNLRNKGCINSYLGNFAEASESFAAYFELASSTITRTFSSLTESQRALYWEQYYGFFTDDIYRFAYGISTPLLNCTAYNVAILGKGLLLNAEMEMRKLILESGDEDALRMYNDIQVSRVKLDRLYEDPVGKKDAIDSLNNDIENRQQQLMKRSKVFGDYTRNLTLKWTDVQSALGKKDIAIEFETYTHKDTTFYIALTLRPDYTEPHLVELFTSKDLERLRPRIDRSGMKDYYASSKMTEVVWGNLSEELSGVENVYFSPAGELNNIGIEYMKDADGKHLLSEKRNYYRLTSTRELTKEYRTHKIADATLYGGILYDVTPETKLTGKESDSERLARMADRPGISLDSLSVTRGGGKWAYLGGSKEEAEAISSTLSSKKVRNDLLEGADGTEESFKALSGAKKDVIHVATHGFYYTETQAARGGLEDSSFMLDGESQAPKEDKALTRSGLLFAGAQNAFDGKDIPIDVEDGILTAKDISRMDLRGTDLVVISACQSGLGEVTGDGVFGLQRGFKKAGVQSIVMSLWEVSDEATKIMMTRFYENLSKGKSKYVSFRDAQNYLRKYDGGFYNEPQYYAAFVLLDAIK